MSELATYRLRVPKSHGFGDLSGYVFANEEHARRWMAQEFVTDGPEGYCAIPVLVPERLPNGELGWGGPECEDRTPKPYRHDLTRPCIGAGGKDIQAPAGTTLATAPSAGSAVSDRAKPGPGLPHICPDCGGSFDGEDCICGYESCRDVGGGQEQQP